MSTRHHCCKRLAAVRRAKGVYAVHLTVSIRTLNAMPHDRRYLKQKKYQAKEIV